MNWIGSESKESILSLYSRVPNNTSKSLDYIFFNHETLFMIFYHDSVDYFGFNELCL